MSAVVDHSKMKLGKRPVRRDSRSMKLATYLKVLPPLAAKRDLTTAMTVFGMMLNDALGDCTCAAIGHIIQAWTANNGNEVTLTDDIIKRCYEVFCGYVDGDESTDNGGVELDVLNRWRQNPIVDQFGNPHKLGAHVLVEAENHEHVKASIDMFGGAYLGIELPLAWQTAEVWSLSFNGDATPGSWGGHAVVAEAYDDDGLTVITWGEKKRLTWGALDVYCSDKNGGEVHACLSDDWVSDGHPCPDGFDVDLLRSDLQAVAA